MTFRISLVIALWLSIPVQAHHSGIMFDPMKQVTLKGTVKEFVFANPHVSIVIAVPDDKGQVVDWSIEAASTQALVRSLSQKWLKMRVDRRFSPHKFVIDKYRPRLFCLRVLTPIPN